MVGKNILFSPHFLVGFYSVAFSPQSQNSTGYKKKEIGLIFVTWRNIWPPSWVFHPHCSGNKKGKK
jgi:hypothetical protein